MPLTTKPIDRRGDHIGQISIADRQRAAVGQPRIGLGQRRRIRSTGDDRRIVAAGDRDGDRLGITQRRAVVVGGPDRVGQDQRLAGGQEIKRFAAAVEVPGQRLAVLGAVEDRRRADGQHCQQRRIARVRLHRGGCDVPLTTRPSTAAVTTSVVSTSPTVSVPAVNQRRIGLGQPGRIRTTGDDRRIVGAGDRDGHRLGIAQRRAIVIDRLDRVGQDQRLAGGQEVKHFGAAVEVPGQRLAVLGAVENRRRADSQHRQQCGVAGCGCIAGGWTCR